MDGECGSTVAPTACDFPVRLGFRGGWLHRVSLTTTDGGAAAHDGHIALHDAFLVEGCGYRGMHV
jgi:hypothetical protein